MKKERKEKMKEAKKGEKAKKRCRVSSLNKQRSERELFLTPQPRPR